MSFLFGRLHFWLLFSIWGAFYFNGVLDNYVMPFEGLPFWLPVVICFFFVFLVRFFLTPRAMNFTPASLVLFFLFLSLFPAMVSGVGLYAFASFSLAFCFFIFLIMGDPKPLSMRDKQFFCDVALIFSFFSIVLFFFYSFVDRPVPGIDPVRPGYGYAIDRGVLLRLVGFAADPNFYVLGSIFPLMVALYEPQLKRRYLCVALILLSVVLTLSRSGFLILVLGLFLLYVRDFKTFFPKLILWGGGAFLASGVVILLISELALTSGGVDRSFSTGAEGRLAFLERLLTYNDLALFGNGIGISKSILGIHSHNTYFDFAYEAGWISFFLFVLYVMLIGSSCFKSVNPSSVFVVLIFLSSFSVSLPFNPILYLVPLVFSRQGYVREC